MVHAIYVLFFAIAIPLVHLALGAGLDRAVGNPLSGQPTWSAAAGGVLAVSGLVLILASIVCLGRIGRGLPISSSPPRHLVTGGPYHWSRHPIYLGAMLTFLGASLLLGSFWNVVLAGPLLGFFYFTYAGGVEEPLLLSRFGQQYRVYQEEAAFVVEFPLRRYFYSLISRALARLSAAINRPKISGRGNHTLFWGYGIWMGVGVVAGLTVMEYVLIAQGLPAPAAVWAVVVVAIIALAATRMMQRAEAAAPGRGGFSHSLWRTGLVSWGALAGLLVVLLLMAWIAEASPFLLLDVTLPCLMVAHIFGGVGCAFYGCCCGKETATGARLRYDHPALKVVPEGGLRPVQLISAMGGAVTAALVFGLWYWLPLPARVPCGLAAAMLGLFRLGEEWLRPQPVMLWGVISPSQLVALALTFFGLINLASIPPGGGPLHYAALSEVVATPVFQQIHPLLLVIMGLMATLLLGYHRRARGERK